MTSVRPPDLPWDVVDQEIIDEILFITYDGPQPDWETREERHAAFMQRGDLDNILRLLAQEVLRARANG